MANTAPLGYNWKPLGWRDGETVPRITLPDGTLAEAMAALGYGWDAAGSVWRKMLVDASGNQIVTLGGTSTVTANQGTAAAQANRWPVFVSDGTAERVGQKTMANSLPVTVASDQSAVPVSGTVTANQGTANATPWNENVAQWIGSTAPSVGQKAMASSLPVAIASDQPALAAPTLTKGTQGATGYSVQELKDAGRVNIMWTAEFAFAQTAETLLTITESRDGAATTTFSSKVVTNAKRLRITSVAMEAEALGSGTTPQRCYLRMRFNTGGAVIASSPLQGVWGLGVTTAIVKASEKESWAFPDGIEYAGDGTKQIGFTLETPDFVATTGTGRAKITITAFEY